MRECVFVGDLCYNEDQMTKEKCYTLFVCEWKPRNLLQTVFIQPVFCTFVSSIKSREMISHLFDGYSHPLFVFFCFTNGITNKT